MVHIGLRIKQLLFEKKIRISELARAIDKTPQSIHNQLSKPNWGTDYLQKVMAAMEITSNDIYQDYQGNEEKLLEENEQMKKTIEEKDLLITLLREKLEAGNSTKFDK